MTEPPMTPLALRLEWDTLLDLRAHGEQVADLVEQLVGDLLVPRLPVSLDELAAITGEYKATESEPWGPPDGGRLVVGGTRNGRNSGGGYTPARWATQLKRLRAGELADLTATFVRLGPTGRSSGGGWSLQVYLRSDGLPHQVSLVISHRYLGDRVDPDTQRQLAALLRSGADALDAAYAWLTLDRTRKLTAHEEVTEGSIGRAMRELPEWARGYHWANVLGAPQVAKLGGAAHVLAAAPCVERTELGGGRVYLQATDDLETFDDDALAALKQFLLPALLRKENRPEFYYGPPIRYV